jgi:starch synthase
VFTIHNVSYQGLFDRDRLPALGLTWDLFDREALEYWGRISYLKAGIVFSDRLTTVSPRYAQEIQTADGGCGFEGIMRGRADVLTGILNGIDDRAWDPAHDRNLPRPFSLETIDDKRDSKRALLERYGLPVDEETLRRPLIGMVARMVEQKGLGLIAGIAQELPRLDATFVVQGEGEKRYEAMWRGLAAAWPDRIGVRIGYEEELAHLIVAGTDLWLMPSVFEPCGLSQMYSQRYGTLPLVRATGGLDGTVESFDPTTGAGTGFKFSSPDPQALLEALRRALAVYRDQNAWRRMQAAAMRKDFSWTQAARGYVDTYGQAMVVRSSDTRPLSV